MYSSQNFYFRSRSSWSYFSWVLLLVMSWGLLLPDKVWSQNYETVEPKISSRDASRTKMQIMQALRNQGAYQQQREKFDPYFKAYLFPKMTIFSAENLAEIAKDRTSLIKLIQSANDGQAQQYLTNMSLQLAAVIARDNYHPASRYNAVLVLKDLDQRYTSGFGTNATPPVPLPKATEALVRLVEEEEFEGVKVPKSVKLGALVGLERHSRFGIDEQLVSRVSAAALEVVAQQEPPPEVQRKVHDWIRCNAAQVLANLSKEGPSEEVHTALTSMIADEAMNLDDRSTIAAQLRKIDYTQANDLEKTSTVQAIGGLTKSIVAEGAKLARKYQEEVLSRGPVGRGARSFRGGIGRREEDELRFERRLFLAQLGNVTTGAVSLAKGLPDEPREQLKGLVSTYDPVTKLAANQDATEIEVTDQVIALERKLTALLDTWQQPAEEEQPAAETAG